MSSLSTGPALDAVPITLSDTTVYDGVRGFSVGGTGTLVVETPVSRAAATTRTLTVTAGQIWPVAVLRFLSTGSTASATLLICALKDR